MFYKQSLTEQRHGFIGPGQKNTLLKDIITRPKVPEHSRINLVDINRLCRCTGCEPPAEVGGVRALLTDTWSTLECLYFCSTGLTEDPVFFFYGRVIRFLNALCFPHTLSQYKLRFCGGLDLFISLFHRSTHSRETPSPCSSFWEHPSFSVKKE